MFCNTVLFYMPKHTFPIQTKLFVEMTDNLVHMINIINQLTLYYGEIYAEADSSPDHMIVGS